MQELKSQDGIQRLEFVNQAIERLQTFNNLFSDEAHFHLNEHVNKENCRYWTATNPKCKHSFAKSDRMGCNREELPVHTFLKMEGDSEFRAFC